MSEGTLTIAIPICDSPAASGTMVYSDFGNEVIEQDVGDLETSLVGDHQRQQQFDALIHRVESFLRLEIDWDAYGGVAAAPLLSPR